MAAVAVIMDDVELDRLLVHIGVAADFPKTASSRSPPALSGGEDGQVDSAVEQWDGKEQAPAED